MKHSWLVGLAALALACGDDTATGGGGQATGGQSTGGQATGGQATGAGGSGGQATGGQATGGQATGGAGGGVVAQAECASAADCKLVDDCCFCEAIPQNESTPTCNVVCDTTQCPALGWDGGTQCSLGQCITGFVCDQALAVCNQMPPVCPAGQTAEIVNGCWGGCVPAYECATVSDCAQCGPDDACVFYGGGFMERHCVKVPSECDGATCACMGPMVCGDIPCGEANGELQCQVP